jgi:predicted metalloprotease with PDZ domain
VQRDPGRKRQTLAESSFDAWTKYYRPDENTPNTVVSYYAKGALVALALDLTLRAGTENRVSLDDVMRTLWLRYGERAGHDGVGVGDDDIRLLAEELSGLELTHFFASAIHGTSELALAPLLKPFGIRLQRDKAPTTPTLGVKTRTDGAEVRLATVYEGGPAQTAGLAAGDLLVAIDGLRITLDSLERLLRRRQAGESIHVHAFRRDELMDFSLRLGSPASDKHKLVVKEKHNVLREGWLTVMTVETPQMMEVMTVSPSFPTLLPRGEKGAS